MVTGIVQTGNLRELAYMRHAHSGGGGGSGSVAGIGGQGSQRQQRPLSARTTRSEKGSTRALRVPNTNTKARVLEDAMLHTPILHNAIQVHNGGVRCAARVRCPPGLGFVSKMCMCRAYRCVG